MDDFMNFMGWRNMMIEERIEEFLAAARCGETEISIDCEDLTGDEVEYLQRELQCRLKKLRL